MPRSPACLMIKAKGADAHSSHWLRFDNAVRILVATQPGEVSDVLRQVGVANQDGLYAAGFVSYEASPTFDSSFLTHPQGPLPLVWFGLFDSPTVLTDLPKAKHAIPSLDWQPSVSESEYLQAVDRIHAWIASGDTYQVNLTLRLRSRFSADPWSFFCHLVRAQPTRHAAFVDTGRHVICSASPELFFRLERSHLECRPMKGTAPRGLTLTDDRRQALALFDSPKDRAENLMIVDMIRNDLGRIACPGSVRVKSLFDLEKYSSLHQLTSTVVAETEASLPTIFGALFPCASVTGAPKVSTMRIIAELEKHPRGIYTGAVGYSGPDRRAEFNVAIRTVHIDRETGRAEYGTGSGIVWDSVARREYEECRTKARLLDEPDPSFKLIETLRWSAGGAYDLVTRHLERLGRSAYFFDFPFDANCISVRLDELATDMTSAGHCERIVRLSLDRSGKLELTDRALESPEMWTLALAQEPIDRKHRFLYHKTTMRAVYDRALQGVPSCDDVLLWNHAGEVTETTRANVAFQIGNSWRTPRVASGLLAGTFRAELLANGELAEGSILCADLARARDVAVFNSVRGWLRVEQILDRSSDGTKSVLWRNPGVPES